jgi:microcystin-dependent protein
MPDTPPRPPGDLAIQPAGAKLSEAEQKMVARLFSDPTYFPVEFRTWLKTYIEGSGITLPASQIKGGGSGSRTGLPAGIIIPYPAAALPPDAIQCDGAAILRTDYRKLFEIIGVTWGAGDGTTTFNIPDFRDRTLYGIGPKVTLAQTDGVASGSRGGPEHHHTFGQTSQPAGAHDHGGSTSEGGYHDHNLDGFTGQTFNMNPITDASINFLQGVGDARTHAAGSHWHDLQTDAAGDHSHFVSGPTSGGFLANRGSFAGVKYAITTGL